MQEIDDGQAGGDDAMSDPIDGYRCLADLQVELGGGLALGGQFQLVVRDQDAGVALEQQRAGEQLPLDGLYVCVGVGVRLEKLPP